MSTWSAAPVPARVLGVVSGDRLEGRPGSGPNGATACARPAGPGRAGRAPNGNDRSNECIVVRPGRRCGGTGTPGTARPTVNTGSLSTKRASVYVHREAVFHPGEPDPRERLRARLRPVRAMYRESGRPGDVLDVAVVVLAASSVDLAGLDVDERQPPVVRRGGEPGTVRRAMPPAVSAPLRKVNRTSASERWRLTPLRSRPPGWRPGPLSVIGARVGDPGNLARGAEDDGQPGAGGRVQPTAPGPGRRRASASARKPRTSTTLAWPVWSQSSSPRWSAAVITSRRARAAGGAVSWMSSLRGCARRRQGCPAARCRRASRGRRRGCRRSPRCGRRSRRGRCACAGRRRQGWSSRGCRRPRGRTGSRSRRFADVDHRGGELAGELAEHPGEQRVGRARYPEAAGGAPPR